jgi:hypothetical protein
VNDLLDTCGGKDHATTIAAQLRSYAARGRVWHRDTDHLPTIAPTIAPTAAIPTPPPVAPTATTSAARTGDRLFVREGYDTPTGRLSVIDPSNGAHLRDLPLGAAAPDWSTLYVTEWEMDQTTVRALNPLTGESLRQTTIAGRYTLPEEGIANIPRGLSPNGRWLALATGQTYAATNAIPFVVLDTTFTQPPKRVDLDGTFLFDALSNDGVSLYLIETLPRDSTATSGLGYKVRVYDLNIGVLQPGVVVDKTAIAQTMSGIQHSSVISPDGQWVYSLYLNQAKGPFIHALNLDGRFAFCIFLPTTGKEDVAKQTLWSLAQTPDGRGLYAANGGLGVVADVDIAQLTVRRTATLPIPAAAQLGIVARVENWMMPSASAKGALTGSAALTPDGKTLFVLGERGIFAVNTRDLTVRGQFQSDRSFDSVTISPDGAHLYAVSVEAGKVLALDPASGATTNSITIASHQPLVVLGIQ